MHIHFSCLSVSSFRLTNSPSCAMHYLPSSCLSSLSVSASFHHLSLFPVFGLSLSLCLSLSLFQTLSLFQSLFHSLSMFQSLSLFQSLSMFKSLSQFQSIRQSLFKSLSMFDSLFQSLSLSPFLSLSLSLSLSRCFSICLASTLSLSPSFAGGDSPRGFESHRCRCRLKASCVSALSDLKVRWLCRGLSSAGCF